MTKAKYSIPTDQNFWQLTSIQAVSIGLAGINLGDNLVQNIGAGQALTSIIIGNLLLWLIALAIVAMSARYRSNSIQNIAQYLGNWGGLFGGAFLLAAFLIWFALQLKSSILAFNGITASFNGVLKDNYLQIGAIFGVLITFLSLGGIRYIKYIHTTCLPLLVLYLIYSALKFGIKDYSFYFWKPSLYAILVTMGYNLGAIINLPTFFRHSKSSSHSFLALTNIFLFFTFFEIYSLCFYPLGFTLVTSTTGMFDIVLALFIIFLLGLTSNMVNIYLAAASLEMIFPSSRSSKNYLVVGFIGTIIFVCFKNHSWLLFLEDIFIGFLGCMGVALLATFLVKIVLRTHRMREWEKLVGVLSWVIGCAVVLISEINNTSGYPAFGVGSLATGVTLLVFVFFEETGWSIKQIMQIYRSRY